MTQEHVEFQELSDEELSMVAGGKHGSSHHKSKGHGKSGGQSNSTDVYQVAIAKGQGALALNVNVDPQLNLTINVD